MLPLIDLKQQYSHMKDKIQREVMEVLESGHYIMGPKVALLEQNLSSFTGVKHCISCASGTDALLMALMAKDIGPGDAIITTPFTFIATAEVISLLGATPIFVDVDEQSFNIDPQEILNCIDSFHSNAKAREQGLVLKGIIAVNLFGLPADYEQINQIAAERELFVIEDAAQSFGASYNQRRSGQLAEISCTSFFPAKPLGGYGDGGAVFCNDDQLAEKLRSIRVHGQGVNKYENVRLGITGRLDEIQAAILNIKLEQFEGEIASRNNIAQQYSEELAHLPLKLPVVPEYMTSAWAQYTIRAESQQQREHLLNLLAEREIASAIYYPIPLHLQQAFQYLGYELGSFPVTEKLSQEVFSIPMHPYLSTQDISEICSVLQEGSK